jgi:large subunit ribosomal protein L9
MKVILLQELKGRGGEGDVVDVTRGFAVNYLFPRNIAIEATNGNLKQLDQRRHNIEKRESARLDSADKILAALDQQKVVIGAKVGEEGQLFGSVTAQQVAEVLSERFDIEVDRKKIDLHGLIKTAGEHPISVSIYRETKATVIIEVVDEKALVAADKAVTEAVTEDVAEEVVQAEEAIEDAEDVENVEAAAAADAEVAEAVVEATIEAGAEE